MTKSRFYWMPLLFVSLIASSTFAHAGSDVIDKSDVIEMRRDQKTRQEEAARNRLPLRSTSTDTVQNPNSPQSKVVRRLTVSGHLESASYSMKASCLSGEQLTGGNCKILQGDDSFKVTSSARVDGESATWGCRFENPSVSSNVIKFQAIAHCSAASAQ